MHVRHVVDDADDYTKIVGKRSQLVGMETFFSGVRMTEESPILLSSTKGSSLEVVVGKDRHDAKVVFLQSMSYRPSKWGVHQLAQRQIMEIITISTGKRSTLTGREAVMNTKRESYWHRLDRTPPAIARPKFGASYRDALFRVSDLSPEWFDEWVLLRQRFARGILAYVSLVERKRDLQVETQCIQFGTVIEFLATDLGHEAGVLKDDGKLKMGARHSPHEPPASLKFSKNKRLENKWKKDGFKFSYEDKVALIYSQVPKVKGLSPSWVASVPNTYNKTKHIDKSIEISALRMIRDVNIGMEVVRMWIATKLGVDASVIRRYYDENEIYRRPNPIPKI